MDSERPTPTNQDYLRLLRQHGLLVALVTIVCAAAALGASLLEKKSYSARATVSVQAPTQDVTLLGGTGGSNQTPAELAAAHAPLVTRPAVAQQVKATLHSALTPAELASLVTASVDPISNLVVVQARAPRAAEAAAIANAFSQKDAYESTLQARQTFANQASNLAQKIRSLGLAKNNTTRFVYADQLSRLQSLSVVASPVQVSGLATVPGAPSSPQPVRNTLVGIFLGLLLGVGAAYWRRTRDHRLQSSQEIEQHIGLPLIGSVRNDALGHAVASNGHGPANDADFESFRILRQNLEFLDASHTTHCIVVTSAKAEEGKSTVAAGLAVASAAIGKLTVLLECDLRRPVLANRFGLSETPGLTDYLAGDATPEQVLQLVPTSSGTGLAGDGGTAPQHVVAGDERELVCITAGAGSMRPAELLASAGFHTLLSELRNVYEVVVIDSSPLLPVADTLELVPYVSEIVVCVRCDHTTRDDTRAVRACLGRLPAKPAGVVATGLRRREAGYYAYGYETSSASPTPR